MSNKSLGFSKKRVTIEHPSLGFLDTLLMTAPTLMFVTLILLFVIAGVAAVFIGQIIARILNTIGVHHALTIWLVPGAPIAVVFLFHKLFKRLGFQL